MSRYCIYESRHNNAHCIVRGQCAACAAYQRGDFPPHFPMPAIMISVTWSYIEGYSYVHMYEYVAWKSGTVRKGVQRWRFVSMCTDYPYVSNKS